MVSTLFRDPQTRSSALTALETSQPRAFGSLNRIETLDSTSNYYVDSVVISDSSSVFCSCTYVTILILASMTVNDGFYAVLLCGFWVPAVLQIVLLSERKF